MNEMTQDLKKLAGHAGDPWRSDTPYYAANEQYMDAQWNMIESFFDETAKETEAQIDYKHTVDLATGHGRNCMKLKDHAEALYLLDYQAGNIEICQKRYADETNFQFAVTNGYDFQPIPDDWATFVYCFDAMVHFDSDVVRAYLSDLSRVLQPCGLGFFHHSNYTEPGNWYDHPHSRNFMSAELFRHYAEKEGLEVVHQKILDWGESKDLDCFSMVRHPE